MQSVLRRLVAVVSATALSASLVFIATGPPAEAAPATSPADQSVQTAAAKSAAKKPAKTSALEKRRSKAVKTPKLKWYSCLEYAKCTTVKVPLDYDKPKGKKVELALLKVPARNQKKKIGSLFVNPGGPGGSGTEIAYYSPEILSPAVTDRFDVVGMDPRGIAFSDNVKCFPSARQNDPVLATIGSVWFPYGSKEEKRLTKAYDKHAKACSTTGKPLSASMSTAQVARDMDLMRRAVGDKKLSYLGVSYGSYLGEVYANLYPDRIRAIAIDGVIDPVQWAGTKKSQSTPVWQRIKSAEGASRALNRALVLCDRAGETKCSFAAGNPVANFEKLAQQLRKTPVIGIDPDTGEEVVITYAEFVGTILAMLYSQSYGPEMVTEFAAGTWDLLYGPSDGAGGKATQDNAVRTVLTLQKAAKNNSTPPKLPGKALGFPYNNGLDATTSVVCTDSRQSKNLRSFPKMAKDADKQAPYFGRLWLWNTASCSSKKWTAKDEDSYRGPFTKRTSAPVLIVGNYWDPATNYSGAVATSKRMPNSRLLLSNSWGHIAYGTSSCATKAVDDYLLSKRLPAKGTVCVGDYVPFTEDLEGPDDEGKALAAKLAKAKRPIAVPPMKLSLR